MISPIDVLLTKAELRRHLLAQRAMLTPAEIAQHSTVIAAYVCALPAFCVSHTIMVYMALPQEVQTKQIITQARQLQKRVAVPVVRGQELVAVALSEAPTQLRRGRFGILEPCGTQALSTLRRLVVLSYPGVAFDYRVEDVWDSAKGIMIVFSGSCPRQRTGVVWHLAYRWCRACPKRRMISVCMALLRNRAVSPVCMLGHRGGDIEAGRVKENRVAL